MLCRMDRRSFFRTMVGGGAASAAVRTWPFRVYSFPTQITIPPRTVPNEIAIWLDRLLAYQEANLDCINKTLVRSFLKLVDENPYSSFAVGRSHLGTVTILVPVPLRLGSQGNV